MNLLLLILTLPAQNATVRMRIWRTLKAAGAAVLRDGAYLLPARPQHQQLFDSLAQDVSSNDGTAYVLAVNTENLTLYSSLFDRSDTYASLLAELQQIKALPQYALAEALRQLRKLRKHFSAVVAIDFFPGEAQLQLQQALQDLELQLNRQLSPDEPQTGTGLIPRLDINRYRGCLWATRKRPWVDRLASAWLIKRFIDRDARFIWLAVPEDCPADALGFDFDGAAFTHINGKVTFEVLLESFSLAQPGLQRLAGVVHFLDVGGIQPAEASGLEQILWGLRNSIDDDDQLITTSYAVFDALLIAFADKENNEREQ